MCGANPDRCYGGIAAEIDTKNMPPAYFLNVSTLSVLAALGHLSQRERQGGTDCLIVFPAVALIIILLEDLQDIIEGLVHIVVGLFALGR